MFGSKKAEQERLEIKFPTGSYPESSSKKITFRRHIMARLRKGERQMKGRQVVRTLRRGWFGLREVEVAQELGWDRRTVNNYLRNLQQQGRVYKEGRCWLVDE